MVSTGVDSDPSMVHRRTSASTGSPNDSAGDKIDTALTGVSETTLVTLRARALDAVSPNSLLHDRWAADAYARLRPGRTHTLSLSDRALNVGVVLRGRQLDAWTADFLEAHPRATVLHLACGLDARCHRVAAAWDRPGVRWLDVDVPEVVALRKRLVLSPEQAGGEYSLVGAVLGQDEGAWLAAVPADRPVLVVMEGLTMYLGRADVEALLRSVCERFGPCGGGEIIADVMGRLTIRTQSLCRPIAATGAVMRFGTDEPRELEAAHERLRLKTRLLARDMPGYGRFPWYVRWALWLMDWVPGVRTMCSIVRFEF